jgi:Flp pilus assembly pilin Flp
MARVWQKIVRRNRNCGLFAKPHGLAGNVPRWDAFEPPVAPHPRPDLLSKHEEKGLAMHYLLRLLRDSRGAGAIEYVLVASLISVAGIAAIDEVGRSVDDNFTRVEAKL